METDITLEQNEKNLFAVAQRMITRREHAANRRDGIEHAKKEGIYIGRKPIDVAEKVLRQVNQELKDDLITVGGSNEKD